MSLLRQQPPDLLKPCAETGLKMQQPQQNRNAENDDSNKVGNACLRGNSWFGAAAVLPMAPQLRHRLVYQQMVMQAGLLHQQPLPLMIFPPAMWSSGLMPSSSATAASRKMVLEYASALQFSGGWDAGGGGGGTPTGTTAASATPGGRPGRKDGRSSSRPGEARASDEPDDTAVERPPVKGDAEEGKVDEATEGPEEAGGTEVPGRRGAPEPCEKLRGAGDGAEAEPAGKNAASRDETMGREKEAAARNEGPDDDCSRPEPRRRPRKKPYVKPRKKPRDAEEGKERTAAGNPSEDWKTEPETPKRRLSAYNLFMAHERARLLTLLNGDESPEDDDRIPPPANLQYEDVRRLLRNNPFQTDRANRSHRKSHGKISFQRLVQRVACGWKNADEVTRASFDRLAREDQARYKNEWKDYKMKLRKRKCARLLLQKKRSAPAASKSSEMQDDGAPTKKIRIKEMQGIERVTSDPPNDLLSSGGNSSAEKCCFCYHAADDTAYLLSPEVTDVDKERTKIEPLPHPTSSAEGNFIPHATALDWDFLRELDSIGMM